MQYEVHVIDQEQMPEGQDLLIVERDGKPAVMLLSGRPATAFRAMRDYETSVDSCDLPSLLYAV